MVVELSRRSDSVLIRCVWRGGGGFTRKLSSRSTADQNTRTRLQRAAFPELAEKMDQYNGQGTVAAKVYIQ